MNTTFDLNALLPRSMTRPDVLTHRRYPGSVPMFTAVLGHRPDLLEVVPGGVIIDWDGLTSLSPTECLVAAGGVVVLGAEHLGGVPAGPAEAVARALMDLA